MRFVPLLLLLLSSGCALLGRGSPPSSEGYVPTEDGGRIFYRLVGRGTDTIVVLHDGPGLHMNAIAPDLAPLARRHVLLFYDQRGGGMSDPAAKQTVGGRTRDPLVNTAHAGDVERLRKHFGMERMTLLGHGWGAGLAALYASGERARVERLLLVSPIPPSREPYAPRAEARLRERLGRCSSRRWSASWRGRRRRTRSPETEAAEARSTRPRPAGARRHPLDVRRIT